MTEAGVINILVGVAAGSIGYAFGAWRANFNLEKEVAALPDKIRDIADKVATHKVAQVRQILDHHDDEIRMHGERLTHLTVIVEQKRG